VHFDFTFGKLASSDWITLGAHFYHPSLYCMVTIATMDFEKRLIMNVDLAILFWRLIDVAVAAFACSSGRHSPVLKFDPDFFVSDGQGSNWMSVRRHWGGSDAILEGREQTCVFHFKQGLNRILVLFKAENLQTLGDEFYTRMERLISETDLDETVSQFQR